MSNYPSNWDSLRKKIYKRDRYTCQECGATDVELHCHHKTPISEGGGHEEENLITVCKDCHQNIHGYEIGSSQESSGEDISDLVWGAVAGILFSILIPPLAIVGVSFTILCIIGIILIIYKEER